MTEDVHCVTRWSRFDVTFEGVHWSALEELVRPKESAHFVVAHAEEGYTANVPISFLHATRSPCSRRTPTASRSRPGSGPLQARDPGQVLLEEREMAARHRPDRDRPPRLGATEYRNDADPFEEERYGF